MKSELIRESIMFSGSRYVLMGLGFLRNIVLAALLLPAEFGEWTLFLAILTYADLSHCGLRHRAERDIPFLRAGRRTDEGDALIRDTFRGTVLLGAVAGSLVSLWGLLPWQSPEARIGYLFAGCVVFTDQVTRFYLMLQRAHKEFERTARVELMAEVVKSVLVVLGAFLAKVPGVLVAFILSNFVLLGWLALYDTRARGRHHLSRRTFAGLLVEGFPLAIVGILSTLQLLIDRFTGGAALSRGDLGIYGMAAIMASVPVIGAQGIGYVAYPRLNELAGGTASPDERRTYFLKLVDSITVIIPVISMAVWFGCPLLFRLVLPKYVPSVVPLTVLLGGGSLYAVTHTYLLFFQVRRRNAALIKAQVLSSLISLTVFIAMLFLLGINVRTLAIAASASLAAGALTLGLAVFRALFQLPVAVGSLARHVLFTACAIGVIALLDFVGPEGEGWWGSIFSAGLKAIIFLVVYTLVVSFYSWKKFFILPDFKGRAPG